MVGKILFSDTLEITSVIEGKLFELFDVDGL